MRTSSTSACAARTLRTRTPPQSPRRRHSSAHRAPGLKMHHAPTRCTNASSLRSPRFAGLAIRAFPQARFARRSRSGVTVAVGAHESGASVKRSSTDAASGPIRPGDRASIAQSPGYNDPARSWSATTSKPRTTKGSSNSPAPSSGTAAYTASTSPTESSDVFSGSGFPIGDRGFAAWSLTASR